MSRAASNTTKAEKTLDEVRRYVGAWAGITIVGSEFQYEPARLSPDDKYPHFKFKLLMHVEFDAVEAVFQCIDGGPTSLLVSLGESADRDIVAWIHNNIVDSLASTAVSDHDVEPLADTIEVNSLVGESV